jgi:hypothetical protein
MHDRIDATVFAHGIGGAAAIFQRGDVAADRRHARAEFVGRLGEALGVTVAGDDGSTQLEAEAARRPPDPASSGCAGDKNSSSAQKHPLPCYAWVLSRFLSVGKRYVFSLAL